MQSLPMGDCMAGISLLVNAALIVCGAELDMSC